MRVAGSCLSFPIRPDERGTFATISNPIEIVAQSIRAILETRQGERVMLPDFGIPDYVFSVVNAFTAGRIKYFLEEQIRKHEPLVDNLEVKIGVLENERFTPGFTLDEDKIAVRIKFTVAQTNVSGNLTFPLWQLRILSRSEASK